MAWPFRSGLLWGIVFAGITYPLFRWIQGRIKARPGVAAGLTVLATILGFAVPILAICWFVVGHVRRFHDAGGVSDLDADRVILRLQGVVDPWLNPFGISLALAQLWETNKAEWSNSIGTGALKGLQPVSQMAFDIGVGFFTQFFVLADVGRWRTWGRTRLGMGADRFDLASRVGATTVLAVFKGVIIVASLQGFIVGLTYLVVGMPNWLLLGVFSGFLCVIPYVGAPVIYVPVGVTMLAQGKIWQGVVVLIVGIGVVSQIDNWVTPFLVAGRVGLHPLVVFVSIIGGVSLMGPVGFIAGPAIAAVLNALWVPDSAKAAV